MIKKMNSGEICELSEGKQMYDFIYIDDAVKAIELCGRAGKNKSEYYIGNSKQYPLREFVIKMNEIINNGSELRFGAVKSQGPFLSYQEFDTYKLEKEFNFRPDISFAEGVNNTLEWLVKGEE